MASKPMTTEAEMETAESPEATAPRRRRGEPLLAEVAWEVVNQLGGIYTVLRSKIPAMTEEWGRRYFLVGPYEPDTASVEFDAAPPTGAIGKVVQAMRDGGYDVHYGRWLVTGRPRVVLMDPVSVFPRLHEIKYGLWEHHNIGLPGDDDMLNRVAAFGHMVAEFFRLLSDRESGKRQILAHFHEWMGAAALPEIRRLNLPLATVFTTHATILGRYLAMNDPWFYDHLPFIDVDRDAAKFKIEPQVRLERAAAHGAHVFTTVSEVTAQECAHLVGRNVDVSLPNGLNIERFAAIHEFQNLHRRMREQINEFVVSHFFPSYSFDLDKTIYFFTSGRYEYRNKGFDMTLEALARLNYRIKQSNLDRTIVTFFITRRPFRTIHPDVLNSKAVMEEMRRTCEAIQQQVGDRLFVDTARGRTPKLDDLVEEYWRLRLRRNMQAWHTDRWPYVVTHDLVENDDDILHKVRDCHLLNGPADPVKVIYHPDFISSSNPLFGLDYDDFVRGCHLGVFPSYYEPWGYTPLECVARGIPAVTTDLSGFGAYVTQNLPDHEDWGVYVIPRRYTGFDEAANILADHLFEFVKLDRRERVSLRNRVEAHSEHFDWHNLVRHYTEAYQLALQRSG